MSFTVDEITLYRQPTEEQRDRMMDAVIDEFDFEKVHRAMEALDWIWMTTRDDGFELPSVSRLKATARELMRSAYRCWNKFGYSYGEAASGGLMATFVQADEEGDATFNLSFVIEEQRSYDYYTPNYPEKE